MAKREVEIKVTANSKKAVSDVDKLVSAVEGLTESLIDSQKETEGVTEGLKKTEAAGSKALKAVATGFKGVGLAIKAAGIGLVIAAFAALKEILEKQQPFLNAVDSVFTSIGIAINQVSKSLKTSAGDFDALGKVMEGILNIGLLPFKLGFYGIKASILALQLAWESSFLGGGDEKKIASLKLSIDDVGTKLIKLKDESIESAKQIGSNLSEAIDEVASGAEILGKALEDLDSKAIKAQADRTVALKNAAQIEEALNKGRFERADRDAELLRQQRDDVRLTIAERITANDSLNDVLDRQEEIMLKGAQTSINAANAELIANNTTENRVALINAQNEADAIRADLAGKRSEQLTNEAALEKEGRDLSEAARILEEKQLKESGERKIQADLEFKLLRAELGLDNPNASPEEKNEDFALKLEALNEQFNQEQALKAEQQITTNATEAEIAAQKLLDTKVHEEKIKAIEKDRVVSTATEEAKAAADKKSIREADQEATIQGASDMLGNLSQLMGEGSAEAKAISLAQATISGIQGVQAAFTSGSAVPIVGVALGPIAAGLAAAVAAKNISKIASSTTGSKKGGGGGGGGGSFSTPRIPTASLSGAAASPELREDSLFSSQTLEGNDSESVGSGRGINQRVFVLESDITDKQNRVSTVESESQIG